MATETEVSAVSALGVTPGEWIYLTAMEGGDGRTFTDAQGEYATIADVHYPESDPSKGDANGYLMAASKELYNALALEQVGWKMWELRTQFLDPEQNDFGKVVAEWVVLGGPAIPEDYLKRNPFSVSQVHDFMEEAVADLKVSAIAKARGEKPEAVNG